MPQFGTFTRNPDTGVLTGSVAFAAARIDFIEVAPNPTRRGEKSPDYQVYGPTGGRFGSGWNKLSKEGKAYIQLVIGNDPTFLDGLEIWPALFETATKDEFAFVWERPDSARARPEPKTAATNERPAPGAKA
ncbi:MAG: DUF736 family protein [Caulobacterales bacterium]